MRTVSLVLVGLACAGQARRVHLSKEQSEVPAELLQAAAPTGAFNPAAPIMGTPARASVSRVQDPSMARRKKSVADKKKAARAIARTKAPKLKGASNPLGIAGFTSGAAADAVGRSDSAWWANELGYFDPAGFTLGATPEQIKVYRQAEVKHGRISMLATLGFVVQEKFHPLFGGGIDGPSLTAIKSPEIYEKIDVVAWSSLLAFFLICESGSFASLFNKEADELGGDVFAPFGFTFDPLGLKPSDPVELEVMQNKELNNGRLAMLAILGMVLQEWKTGEPLFG